MDAMKKSIEKFTLTIIGCFAILGFGVGFLESIIIFYDGIVLWNNPMLSLQPITISLWLTIPQTIGSIITYSYVTSRLKKIKK